MTPKYALSEAERILSSPPEMLYTKEHLVEVIRGVVEYCKPVIVDCGPVMVESHYPLADFLPQCRTMHDPYDANTLSYTKVPE
jgi:hypothetical protein